MQWVLMLIMVTGTGASARMEVRTLQDFDTQALCQAADDALTAGMGRGLGAARAQAVQFTLRCVQAK